MLYNIIEVGVPLQVHENINKKNHNDIWVRDGFCIGSVQNFYIFYTCITTKIGVKNVKVLNTNFESILNT